MWCTFAFSHLNAQKMLFWSDKTKNELSILEKQCVAENELSLNTVVAVILLAYFCSSGTWKLVRVDGKINGAKKKKSNTENNLILNT